MKRLLPLALLFCAVCTFSSPLWAQTRTLSGRVLARDTGEPIVYATVIVKDFTNLAQYTDDAGRFSISNVPVSATHITVGYIGYVTQEVSISGINSVTVTLDPDVVALDQVVVTALGIQRQARETGYAIAKVNAEELTNAGSPDASSALAGKVSGLEITMPGYGLEPDVRVSLRGSRSFRGSNQAMLVLDGIPAQMNMLQTLNPNDIENISVMKGGSGAALYGSSAANGVIYVTTKKATRGKPRITYGLTMTFDDATAYLPKWQTRFGPGGDNATTSLPEYMPEENQQYGPEFDGTLRKIGVPIYNPDDPTYDGGKQLYGIYSAKKGARSDFYNTGVSLQNDISYSAGDENGSLFFSYQRVNTTGQIPGDKGVRQGVRFNGSKKYGIVNLNANVSYTNMNNNATNTGNAGIYDLMSAGLNHYIPDYKDWRNTEGGRPDEWIGSNYYNNPYFNIEMSRQLRRIDRLTGSANLEIKPLKWLTLQGRAGMNLNTTNEERRQYAWNYNTAWGRLVGRSFAQSKRYSNMREISNYNQTINLDAMALTQHKLTGDLGLKTLLGWSMRDDYRTDETVIAANLEIDDFFNVKNKLGELTGSNEWRQQRSVSVYGSINLAYKNWAFLELTGRNDWTSLLAPKNWSFFYPGANASVMLTDAIPSMKGKNLSYLKLRGTYAKTGTVNIGIYELANLSNPADNYPYGTLTSYVISTSIRNPNIQPEFTTEFEFGVELGLLKDRIMLEAAVYQQNTTNQTVSVSLPYSAGFANMNLNAGEMRGRGLELDLRLTPLFKIGDLRWNFNANFTWSESRVMDIYGDMEELVIDAGYGNFSAKVGKLYPWFKGSDWDRDPEGRVIVSPSTGYPTINATLQDMGTTSPKYRLGLGSRVFWKDFTLNVTAEYRGGHIARFVQEDSMLFQGTSYNSALMGRQRFVIPNSVIQNADGTFTPNTDITVASGGRNFFAESYRNVAVTQVVSAASWRIREASIAYNIPQKWVDKTKIVSRASISVVGRNLALFTPKTNMWGDPDGFSTGNTNLTGYQSQNRSLPRTLGFNLSVTF